MSQTVHWTTPKALYEDLDREFHFNDDPCPLHGSGGLDRPWGDSTYCNPPYGREIGKWIVKAYTEARGGKTVVLLVPSRTDTAWFQDYCLKADEIRFIKGRLKFGDAVNSAPFPSAVVVFRG